MAIHRYQEKNIAAARMPRPRFSKFSQAAID